MIPDIALGVVLGVVLLPAMIAAGMIVVLSIVGIVRAIIYFALTVPKRMIEGRVRCALTVAVAPHGRLAEAALGRVAAIAT